MLMLNSPRNSSRREEQCEIRSKEATVLERRNGLAIIGCQECHLLSACEWEEFEICCSMMLLWRWVTGCICLIWHITNSTRSHYVHLDRKRQQQKQEKVSSPPPLTYPCTDNKLSLSLLSPLPLLNMYHSGQSDLFLHLLSTELSLLQLKRIGERPRKPCFSDINTSPHPPPPQISNTCK